MTDRTTPAGDPKKTDDAAPADDALIDGTTAAHDSALAGDDRARFERMLRSQLDSQRAEADALRVALDGIRSARSDGTADDEHDPEGSTLSSDWSQLSGLSSEATMRVESIERALTRIGDGSYGVCTGCGRDIPPERLEVRPAAERCVPCASGVTQSR